MCVSTETYVKILKHYGLPLYEEGDLLIMRVWIIFRLRSFILELFILVQSFIFILHDLIVSFLMFVINLLAVQTEQSWNTAHRLPSLEQHVSNCCCRQDLVSREARNILEVEASVRTCWVKRGGVSPLRARPMSVWGIKDVWHKDQQTLKLKTGGNSLKNPAHVQMRLPHPCQSGWLGRIKN